MEYSGTRFTQEIKTQGTCPGRESDLSQCLGEKQKQRVVFKKKKRSGSRGSRQVFRFRDSLRVRGRLVANTKKFWLSRQPFDQMSGGFFGH